MLDRMKKLLGSFTKGLPTPSLELVKEFQNYLVEIRQVSMSGLSLQQRQKQYGRLLDKLSDEAYETYFLHILGIVQPSKEDCQKFKNSKAQVRDILSWLPRMRDKKELVLLDIQQRRKKYNLEV